MEELSIQQMGLYQDCIAFWQRLGVKREDNLIALSSLDVYNVFKSKTKDCYKELFYIENGKALLEEFSKSKYDDNRGKNGWLKKYDF